jgi:hypothetical protein
MKQEGLVPVVGTTSLRADMHWHVRRDVVELDVFCAASAVDTEQEVAAVVVAWVLALEA